MESYSGCLVCHQKYGLKVYNAKSFSKFSGTSFYDLIESIVELHVAEASVSMCKSCVDKLNSFDEHYTIAMTVKDDLNNLYKAATEIEHVKIESNVEPEIFEFISMEEHAMSGNQPSSSGKLKCEQVTANTSTPIAETTTMKRLRDTPQSSDFLENFTYDEATNKTKCIICLKNYTGFLKHNLKRHLLDQHPDHGKALGVSYSYRNPEKYDQARPAKKARNGPLSRGQFIQFCISLVEFSLAPLSLFNSIAFRALTRIDCERHNIIMNKKIVAEFVTLAAYGVRQRIKKEVKNKLISIKLDIATRHARTVLGINIQFYCTLRKKIVVRTLGCIELTKRHKSAYLKVEVNKILDAFEIDRRSIYCFTCDTGANTLSLGKLLKRMQRDMFLSVSMRKMHVESDDEDESDESEDEESVGNEEHVAQVSALFVEESSMPILAIVRCAALSLQLATDDALENTGSARLHNIRSIVKNLKSSRYLAFVPAGFKRLRLDVATRWSSLYVMIESVLNQRHVLEKLYDELKDREDDRKDVLLSEDDFGFMQNFLSAFHPIFILNEQLQTEEMAMSELLILWYKCKEKICKLDSEANIFARPLLEAYDKRGDTLMENILLASAAYVDPRIHHSKSSTKLLGGMQTDVENRLLKVIKQIRSNKISPSNPSSSSMPDEMEDDDNFDKFFDAELENNSEPSVSETAEEKELKEKIMVLGQQTKVAMKTNIFEYYEDLHDKALIDDDCFKLVMTVLSAPATQVSVDRTFSALTLVSEPHNSNLKAEMIDDILVSALNQDVFVLVDFENMKS